MKPGFTYYFIALSVMFGGLRLTGLAQSAGDRVPDHYIVQVRQAVDPDAVAARHQVTANFVYSAAIKGFAATIPPGLLRRFQNDPDVLSITPDRIVSANQIAAGKPGGGGGGTAPGETIPAGVARIGAAPGANLGLNGAGVGVAIVDTGIDLNHADLSANIGSAKYSAYGGTGQDDQGHGTHVAGIVGAVDNEIGVVGVAPGVKLYAVKVLDSAGNGTDAIVQAGLDWIAANAATTTPPIRVVNMSLGRPGTIDDNPALRASVQALASQGIAVVVAAGNDPNLTISQSVPAVYPEAIAIASTTAKTGAQGKVAGKTFQIAADTASYFTTDGPEAAVSAPGEDQEDVKNGGLLSSVGILSCALGGGTIRMSGTSMASPHAAGVAALLWQQALNSASTLTPEDVRRKLRTGAGGQGLAPKDSPTGGYSFDGIREGVLSAPGALSAP